MIKKARTALKIWSSKDAEISRKLLKIAGILTENKREFAMIESSYGKPITEALQDVEAAAQVFEFYSRILPHQSQSETVLSMFEPEKVRLSIKREPIGVVGLITSFNYPLLILSWKLAPALAAGCAVIAKPHQSTPHSTLLLQKYLNDILPTDLFQVIEGGAKEASDLIAKVDMVSFTGSSQTGKAIAQSCAARLIPATLELGGKNACVIAADCNLDKATTLVVEGAFANAGQNCCAISRLFIHKDVYQEAVKLILEKTASLKYGPLLDIGTQIGNLINSAAFRKVDVFIEQAKIDGLHFHSFHKSNPLENFMAPHVFTKVPDTHDLAQKEIFGPVLLILEPYETIQEVVSRVNECEYSLAAGIFTNSDDVFDEFVNGVDVGYIWHNTWNDTVVDLGFGGRTNSGMGKELGREALESFYKKKSVVSRRSL